MLLPTALIISITIMPSLSATPGQSSSFFPECCSNWQERRGKVVSSFATDCVERLCGGNARVRKSVSPHLAIMTRHDHLPMTLHSSFCTSSDASLW